MGMEKGLPENWRERIAGKKVILYNTSIGNLLSGGEKHIDKISQVLDTFRSQSEVVLWWRPHPLELSTVESMRPDLAIKYKAVRNKYEEEDWGILDISADVHRAIAISDAYYGDWSSLIHLYEVTGKPILLSNDEVMEQDVKFSFDVQDFVIADNCLWFISASMNLLFCMDIKTFEVIEAIKIPYGNVFDKYVTYCIANVGEYLVLIPGCGKWFIRFSIRDRRFDAIDFGKWSASTKFGSYCIHGGYLYTVPTFDNRIVKYDVKENVIVSEKKIKDINKRLFLETNTDYYEKSMYAVEGLSNCVYKYNIEEETCDVIQIEGEALRFGGIKKINDSFLITLADKNEMIMWEEKNNRTITIEGLPTDFYRGDRPYSDIVVCGSNAFLFPNTANMILKLDSNTLKVEKLSDDKKDEKTGYYSHVTCAKLDERKIYAFNAKENCWLVADTDTNEIEQYEIKVKNEILDGINSYSIFRVLDDENENKNGRFIEREDSNFYSLQYFVKNIISNFQIEIRNVEKEADTLLCGRKIHAKMLE